jgi:SAM-dependent methyltransferase
VNIPWARDTKLYKVTRRVYQQIRGTYLLGERKPTVAKFACPCCCGQSFFQVPVISSGLAKEWSLTPAEVQYMDRQQGMYCTGCGCNLRSMTLARAILNGYGFSGTLKTFVEGNSHLHILQINHAGQLNDFLQTMPNHLLTEYPKVDMQALPFADNTFDLVVHSDTLEHVTDPLAGLTECCRVLRDGGLMCYTVPAIVGRLSMSRQGKAPSFHGAPGKHEYRVSTEYGSDCWIQVLQAGFAECRITTLELPSIALTGVKRSP